MESNQPHQPSGPGPQPPYHPPEYTISPNVTPQRHENGQYEVVPPPPATANTGHTGHNAYEFIMQSDKPKRKFSFGIGKGLYMRVGLILSGVVLLVIVVTLVASSLAPAGSTPQLVAIVERQQEILRISSAAVKQTTGEDTTNFVTNVSFSITTSQQQFISYLAKHATKIDKKTLALDQDPQTDTLLASATTANNFDPAVVSNLTDQLQTYQTLLRTAYKNSTSKETKQLLSTNFDGADLLVRQAKALSPTNN